MRPKIDCSPAGLEALADRALGHAMELGLSTSWQRLHRWGWRSLVRFAQDEDTAAAGLSELVQDFLASRGIREDVKGRELRPIDSKLRATMRALKSFAFHGSFAVHRRWRPDLHLPAGFAALVDGYVEHLRDERGLAERTVRDRRALAQRFFHFLDLRGITSVADIDASLLSELVASRAHLRPFTLANEIAVLRTLLRYLCQTGLISPEVTTLLPTMRVHRNTGIPSVWSSEEVERLLGAVDRSSPVGKRDFAILVLVARLGIRAGDVRALRLESLRWDEGRIDFLQGKTGVPQSLPLTEEIGAALIDYLRHGRPESDHREVFLTAAAPFRPFHEGSTFYKVITKYRLLAGIEAPADSARGLHSLRHTVATRLLEAGTPLQTISSVMGHISPETTRVYMKVDVAALRSAALDPEAVGDA